MWGAGCAFLATILRNFAAYAAALAGYTAIIIASGELGATGGASGQVFLLAVTRASEICIGIVSAGVVLAGTDLGGARRQLAVKLAALSTQISRGLVGTFSLTGPELLETRSARRDLVRQVIALDPLIDEVIGESSECAVSLIEVARGNRRLVRCPVMLADNRRSPRTVARRFPPA